MRIGLIRHGLTDWNAAGRIQGQTDIPLNGEGREQAERLGRRLLTEEYQWDYIITSGLSRAQETGEIISKLLNVPLLEPDARLKERAFGQIEGLTSEERVARWGKSSGDIGLGTGADSGYPDSCTGVSGRSMVCLSGPKRAHCHSRSFSGQPVNSLV